ncbi:MAG: amidohydrolase family protein [Nannocystaceae bacterium]|nr:amidohydrolase family protein [Nannocystaceae bacterium]
MIARALRRGLTAAVLLLAPVGPSAAAPAAKPAAARPAAAARGSDPRPRSGARPRGAARLAFDHDGPPIVLVGAELRSDGRRITDAVIELRGTRIAAVGGPELAARAPADARRIDLRGAIVTPGLVALETAMGAVEIDAEGSTRDDTRATPDPIRAAFDASSAVHEHSTLLQVAAIDGITSAAITPQGGLVSGSIAWLDLAGAPGQRVARGGVGMRAHLGQAVEGSRAATLQRIAELFDDVRFYRDHRGAFDRNQSRDLAAHRLDLEALVPVVAGTMPLVLSAHGEADLRAAITLAQAGARVVVVGGTQAWRMADALARARIPVLLQPSSNLPGALDHLGARLDNAALLAAAGVEVGIAVMGDAHNARNLTQEAGIAVSYGLDPDRALSAITAVPARALGMDAHYGAVAPGKVANLVVWRADPFELSSKPEAVWIRGESIPLVSRQTQLRDRYLQRLRDTPKARR